MPIIKKLPLLLPLFMSIIICFLGLYYDYDLEELSVKLIISIILFTIMGYLLRDTIIKFLINVLRENERKIKYIKEYELEKNKQMKKKAQENLEPYIPNKLE